MYLVLLSPLFHSSPSSLSLSLFFFSCLWLIGEICLSVEQFIFYIRLSADLWFCLVSTPISCILYKIVLFWSQPIDGVVMLSAKNASGTHLGWPHRHFSDQGQWCGWADPCGSYYDCRMHLSNNHDRTLKKQTLLFQSSVDCQVHVDCQAPLSMEFSRPE